MKIHGFIFNWQGQYEKTRQKETQLTGLLDRLTVISSGEGDPHWVNIGEESYFGAQFLKALELFDGDVLFHVQGDVSSGQWADILQSAREQFELPTCGIYAPNVDFTNWTSDRVDCASLGSKMKLVTMTDCSCWFIRNCLVEEFKSKYSCCFYDNKYGWGADEALCSRAREMGFNVIRDYNYTVDHPKTTRYDSRSAITQMKKFFMCNYFMLTYEKERDNLKETPKVVEQIVAPQNNEIPVYCINLKRAPERRQKMIEEWVNKRNININFFDAIDRLGLSFNNLPAPYDENFKNRDIEFSKKLGIHIFSLGNVCCSISHCELLKTLIDSNIEEAIILEDDAQPLFDTKDEFFDAIKKCKEERGMVDILLLHQPLKDLSVEVEKNNFYTLKETTIGTQSIYYNKKGMQSIYEEGMKLHVPIDYTGNLGGIIENKRMGIIKNPLTLHSSETTYINEHFHMCKKLYIGGENDESISADKTIKCSFIYNSIDQTNMKIFELLINNNSEIICINGSDKSGEKMGNIRYDVLKNSKYTIVTGAPDIAVSNIIKAKSIGVIPIYIYEDINLLNKVNINWNDICILLHMDISQSFIQRISNEPL